MLLLAGIAITVAVAILVSLSFGVSLEVIAPILMLTSIFLLVVGIYVHWRQTKRNEEQTVHTAEFLARQRGRY